VQKHLLAGSPPPACTGGGEEVGPSLAAGAAV
jgi:hypothetical protein